MGADPVPALEERGSLDFATAVALMLSLMARFSALFLEKDVFTISHN